MLLGFENVNFGPVFVLTPWGGPTPDMILGDYSPGGPEKNGFRFRRYGPLEGRFCMIFWPTFDF